MYEGSFFPASLPTFVVGGVLDASHSNRGEVESKCGFDLHFLYGHCNTAFIECVGQSSFPFYFMEKFKESWY
jgi:hypothetical protein